MTTIRLHCLRCIKLEYWILLDLVCIHFAKIVGYILNVFFFSLGEYFTNRDNSFDQLCINYSNERFQQYFFDVMLVKEKECYGSQGLDIPFIPFFDNFHIVGKK